MKVGINLELMEKVLKEPSTIEIGAGGEVPDTASTGSDCPGTVGGGRRVNVGYEKAPWIEATVRSVLPESSANMYDMWFYVNHGRDEMILCQQHYNGHDDEAMPHDFMNQNLGCGKECITCRASEMARWQGITTFGLQSINERLSSRRLRGSAHSSTSWLMRAP